MSGSQALSVDIPAPATNNSRRMPREAAMVDVPVPSPVHDLQGKLERLQDLVCEEPTPDHMITTKAPGWVRLATPIALSIMLWSAIFWIVGLVR